MDESCVGGGCVRGVSWQWLLRDGSRGGVGGVGSGSHERNERINIFFIYKKKGKGEILSCLLLAWLNGVGVSSKVWLVMELGWRVFRLKNGFFF